MGLSSNPIKINQEALSLINVDKMMLQSGCYTKTILSY